MSIALDGQALNITLTNNGDNLDFGIVGCRSAVPHLQRLIGHLEDSLAALEESVGQKSSKAKTAAPAKAAPAKAAAKKAAAKKTAAPRKSATASPKSR
jgi:peptidoglycan hydrolase CwlO-like protein